jgi:hypothetical protein
LPGAPAVPGEPALAPEDPVEEEPDPLLFFSTAVLGVAVPPAAGPELFPPACACAKGADSSKAEEARASKSGLIICLSSLFPKPGTMISDARSFDVA